MNLTVTLICLKEEEKEEEKGEQKNEEEESAINRKRS